MRSQSISSLSPVSDPALLTAISLTSFSALLLELALTRLFSVVLFYHFAFLAISVALLGLGAGGVFAYLWRNWLAGFETRRLAATLSSGNAVAIVFTLFVVLHVPVSLDLSRGNLFHLTEIYMTSAVPFSFTGLIFSVVFAREARQVTRLYGADLLGGALACLAVVPLLNWLGGPNALLFAAFTSGMAAIVWKRKHLKWGWFRPRFSTCKALCQLCVSCSSLSTTRGAGSMSFMPRACSATARGSNLPSGTPSRG